MHWGYTGVQGVPSHSLGDTNYAYVREEGGCQDIQEKQPYTDNRMEEYASSGTYYFSSALVMKEAMSDMVDQGMDLNGEYYVSLCIRVCWHVKSLWLFTHFSTLCSGARLKTSKNIILGPALLKLGSFLA